MKKTVRCLRFRGKKGINQAYCAESNCLVCDWTGQRLEKSGQRSKGCQAFSKCWRIVNVMVALPCLKGDCVQRFTLFVRTLNRFWVCKCVPMPPALRENFCVPYIGTIAVSFRGSAGCNGWERPKFSMANRANNCIINKPVIIPNKNWNIWTWKHRLLCAVSLLAWWSLTLEAAVFLSGDFFVPFCAAEVMDRIK